VLFESNVDKSNNRPKIYLTFINCECIGCMQRRKKHATTVVLEGLSSLSISIPLSSMNNRI
jgi:hypothetical protein